MTHRTYARTLASITATALVLIVVLAFAPWWVAAVALFVFAGFAWLVATAEPAGGYCDWADRRLDELEGGSRG